MHNNCIRENDITKLINTPPLKKFNTFNIKLINMENYVKELNVANIGKWTQEINFKIFLPQILPDLDKILFLDVDLIVKNDLSTIFNIDMQDNIFLGSGKSGVIGICGGAVLFNIPNAKIHNITYHLSKIIKEKGITEDNAINTLYYEKTFYTNNTNILHAINHKKGSFIESPYKDIIIYHYIRAKPYHIEKKYLQYATEATKEYWLYLAEFINPKYKYHFIMLKFYAIYIAMYLHPLIRRIKKFKYKNPQSPKYIFTFIKKYSILN
jgi:lipopolysaccharide biosynthesis glycosyltransferase